jgi:novel protein kinase C epsilon type
MNVHKRCQKNVANNCGINAKVFADTLMGLGFSGDKLSKSARKKKASISESPNKLAQSVTKRSETSPLPSTADHNEPFRIDQHLMSGEMASHFGQLSFKDSLNREQEKALQHVLDRTTAAIGGDGDRRRRYGLEDFVFIKVLGKGSFGKVSFTKL